MAYHPLVNLPNWSPHIKLGQLSWYSSSSMSTKNLTEVFAHLNVSDVNWMAGQSGYRRLCDSGEPLSWSELLKKSSYRQTISAGVWSIYRWPQTLWLFNLANNYHRRWNRWKREHINLDARKFNTQCLYDHIWHPRCQTWLQSHKLIAIGYEMFLHLDH